MVLAGDVDDAGAVDVRVGQAIAEVPLALAGAKETLRSSVTSSLLGQLGRVVFAGDEVEVLTRTAFTGHLDGLLVGLAPGGEEVVM